MRAITDPRGLYIMKRLSIKSFKALITVFLICVLTVSCDNPVSKEEEEKTVSTEGFCIYLTDVDREDGLTDQEDVLENSEMIGDPVLAYNEIISYDTMTHTIDMSITRKEFFKRVATIGENNEGFLVTLDSVKTYIGWFCGSYSSVPRDNVVIMFDTVIEDLDSNQIRLKLGYPDESQFTRPDPRDNKSIFERLKEDGCVPR